MITAAQFSIALPNSASRIPLFLAPLNSTMAEFGIVKPNQIAAFLAQLAHESAEFTRLSENLNYSATGLLTTFPTHFNQAGAAEYARQPERIANHVYANRLGNGDEASGDGWKYRGRGLIQITGFKNYQACAYGLQLPLVDQPDLLVQPTASSRSAGYYWKSNRLNDLADKGDFTGICGAINCGNRAAPPRSINGYAQRLDLFNRFTAALKG